MAELAASKRRADGHGGAVTLDDLNRQRPLTPEEIAEAEATLDAFEQAEVQAGRVGRQAQRRRPRAARPTAASGKVLLRLPRSVHQELIARAEAEHTSLNQLVLAYVSRGLGQDAGRDMR